MRLYLAGPMRGIPEWNFPAFDAAEEEWSAYNHQVFNPAKIATAYGYGPHNCRGEEQDHLRHVIRSDIECIMMCDAVALLPGWENSRGATVEVALAHFLGLPLLDATKPNTVYMLEPSLLDPDKLPWKELIEYHKMYRRAAETACRPNVDILNEIRVFSKQS